MYSRTHPFWPQNRNFIFLYNLFILFLRGLNHQYREKERDSKFLIVKTTLDAILIDDMLEISHSIRVKSQIVNNPHLLEKGRFSTFSCTQEQYANLNTICVLLTFYDIISENTFVILEE